MPEKSTPQITPVTPIPNNLHGESIIGCWKMVELWDVDDNGKKTYSFGNPPLGYWVYDTSGNVSVQISMNPPLPLLPNGYDNLSKADLVAMLNAYMAYFGTYVVDYGAGTWLRRFVRVAN